MDEAAAELRCLNCNNSEMNAPLVAVRYAGEQIWICTPCMPILIHKPQQMIGALRDADKIPPSAHHH